MKFEDFLRNYWDKFVAEICEFEPLTHEFMAKYEYELNWRAISKNERIEWTLDFIRKYELKFNWSDLARNEAITWLPEWKKEFKEQFNPYRISTKKRTTVPQPDPYVASNIVGLDLEKLFNNKFDYSQRYFFLTAVEHDRYGLTPEFEIEGKPTRN